VSPQNAPTATLFGEGQDFLGPLLHGALRRGGGTGRGRAVRLAVRLGAGRRLTDRRRHARSHSSATTSSCSDGAAMRDTASPRRTDGGASRAPTSSAWSRRLAPMKAAGRLAASPPTRRPGRGGVDPLLEAEEGNATLLQPGDGRQQLGGRPPQPVEAHDGQRVTRARVVEQGGEAWPVHGAAGADVGEHGVPVAREPTVRFKASMCPGRVSVGPDKRSSSFSMEQGERRHACRFRERVAAVARRNP
jgi:hypothetical protein